MFTRSLRAVISFALVLALLMSALPVSAAEVTRSNPLGSLSGVGNVQLRGVRADQEGTLFTGDHVRTGVKGYAKVSLINGNRIELDQNSEITVNGDGKSVQLALSAGNFGFTMSNNPIAILIQGVRIEPKANSKGFVSSIGDGFASVRVVSGSVMLRNTQTKSSTVVTGGSERIVNLKTLEASQSLGQMASALPTSLPSVPTLPQGSSSSKAKWAAIAFGAGGAAIAIAIIAKDDNAPLVDTALQAKVSANLASVASSTTAASAAATSAASVATAASTSTAVSAADKTVATQIVASLTSASTTLASQTSSLSSLQSQAGGATTTAQFASIQAQILTLTAQINATIDLINTQLANLRALETRNTGFTQTVPTNVNKPTVSSASVPD